MGQGKHIFGRSADREREYLMQPISPLTAALSGIPGIGDLPAQGTCLCAQKILMPGKKGELPVLFRGDWSVGSMDSPRVI